MKIDVLTLFPEMFKGPINESILKRAQEKGIVEIQLHQLRQFTFDRHQTADDKPYGGGSGMVMKIEPIVCGVEKLKRPKTKIIVPSPRGERMTQKIAAELSEESSLLFVCGHYEGIDERLFDLFSCRQISVGDYVLTNGELPAMVILDSLVRLIPGVLGNADSLNSESFEEGLLEYPQYTRPAEFKGKEVPEVLLSGDHEKIKKWKQQKREEMTLKFRPDLLNKKEIDNR